MRTRYPYDVFNDVLEWAVAVFGIITSIAFGITFAALYVDEVGAAAWAFGVTVVAGVLTYGALVWWLKRNFV